MGSSSHVPPLSAPLHLPPPLRCARWCQLQPHRLVASYSAGLDSPSHFSVALRFLAQAVGTVGGALAISELMLARHGRAKAIDILVNDLKVFPTFNEEFYKEITQLVTLENFRHDRAKAIDILVNDLKVFSTFNEEFYKEITQLVTLENFRM
uniref:TPR1-like CTLH-containing domain-containing protein n=1 Tax=Zea mays TaxID=4577 RepID=A0A804LLM5_MAIZE